MNLKELRTLLSILVVTYAVSIPGAFAQSLPENANPTLTKTIPPSPKAASLGQYGEHPVSNYTGLPDISIPIYEVTSGDLNLPISLSYHAGGVKVEEIASNVGLKWSLNAGGVITRTIRGLADEEAQGWGNYRENYLAYDAGTANDQHDLRAAVKDGDADMEADIYHFNFGGRSGKFILDSDPATPDQLYAVLIPKSGLKITFDKSGSEIIRWRVKTEDGTTYVFGKSEDDSREGIETNSSASLCANGYPGNTPNESQAVPIKSSWYLVEVISLQGFRIDLFYESYDYEYRTFGNETAYVLLPGENYSDGQGNPVCAPRYTYCHVKNIMSGRRLTKIEYNNGHLDFVAASEYRVDLCQDKALASIRIFNDSRLIKEFEMEYDYFKRPTDPVPPVITNCSDDSDEHVEYRLKLESVTEVAPNGERKPPYVITYDETHHLPPRMSFVSGSISNESFGQDHWGYYNGEPNNKWAGTNNATLIPSMFSQLIGPTGGMVNIDLEGADRSTSESHMKAYNIKRITYPTGGYAEFEFEANKIASDQIPDEYTLTSTDRTAGPFLFSSDNTAGSNQVYPTFTINTAFKKNGVFGAQVETRFLEIPGSNCDLVAPGEILVNRYIYDAVTDLEVYSNDSQNGEEIFLPNGDYYVKLERKATGYDCDSQFSMTLVWVETNAGNGLPADVVVGGLRVSQITVHDGISTENDQITTFDYQRFDDANLSSGYMVNFPVYSWGIYRETHKITPSGGGSEYPGNCNFLNHQSYSHYPLATTGGGIVGYKNVRVSNGAGHYEYVYTTSAEFPDELAFLAPSNSYDFRRGKLLKQTASSYDQVPPTEVIKVSEEETSYSSPNVQQHMSRKFILVETGEYGDVMLEQVYGTASDHVYPSSQITRSSFEPDESRWVEQTQTFNYSSTHFQLAESTISNSDGGTYRTKYTYPLDLHALSPVPANPIDGEGQALRKMIDQHILNQPIETQLEIVGSNGTYLIDARVNTFQLDNLGKVQPHKVVGWEGPTPVTDFSPVSYTDGAGLQVDDDYSVNAPMIEFREFDEKGQPLEVLTRDGLLKSFIWGYDGEHVVAEVVGASRADLESALGGTIDLQVSGVTLSQGQIEQLRSTLPDAFITTYDYEPKVGLVSKTDPNGMVTRYQYDSFNRLQQVRDDDGYILTEYQYNYANQNSQP